MDNLVCIGFETVFDLVANKIPFLNMEVKKVGQTCQVRLLLNYSERALRVGSGRFTVFKHFVVHCLPTKIIRSNF